MLENELEKVTRFEVIDHTVTSMGRVYVKYGISVSMDLQDDGRTLKVFLGDSEIATPGEVKTEIAQHLIAFMKENHEQDS